MSVKKTIYSILLGIGNVLLFSIVSQILIYIFKFNLNGEMLHFIFLAFIFSFVVFNVIFYKLHEKLFKNTRMFPSAIYASLFSLSWLITFLIMIEKFAKQIEDLWLFGIFILLEIIANFIFALIYNIIFMIKNLKNDKKVFWLISGILTQFLIPILYICIWMFF